MMDSPNRNFFVVAILFFVGFSLCLSACSELKKPEPEPFYSQTKPPKTRISMEQWEDAEVF